MHRLDRGIRRPTCVAPFERRYPLVAGLVGVALGAASSAALAVSETEPNNTFPGQAASVGTLYTGFLCLVNCFGNPIDDLDLYHFSGLTPGEAFDLTGTQNPFSSGPDFTFGRYTDQTTVVDSATTFNANDVIHLTGLVPLSGELTFGVTTSNAFAFEGYSIILDVRRVALPEPATLALLAAGLAGALVSRRRKRS